MIELGGLGSNPSSVLVTYVDNLNLVIHFPYP